MIKLFILGFSEHKSETQETCNLSDNLSDGKKEKNAFFSSVKFGKRVSNSLLKIKFHLKANPGKGNGVKLASSQGATFYSRN